ncbi:MAG: sigma-70 family RNA polymerase sigma factor [Deltaproteobacteria bacterium]|nr:sigma-70 family RNA polymerase sigma factor [Deltaproteobacteria bacterium]
MTVASLYAVHRPYVAGVVRSLGAPDADVDDLTHEVFCVLLRRSVPLQEPRGARRWLYQAARRVVSNHRRARRRDAARREHAWIPGAGPCPERAAQLDEARRRLGRQVEALPAQGQALYQLSEVDELPGPVVAERLGLNPNTAYARVRSMRRRLLQALVMLLLLATALLVSALGCTVQVESSHQITRAAAAPRGGEHEPRHAALRGPALGLGLTATAR